LTEGSLQVLSWYDGASVSRQRGQHCQRWTMCLPSIGGVHEKQVEANFYELRMNGLQGGEIAMTICGHFLGVSILLSSARFTDKISITLPNVIVANNRSALSNFAMQVCRSIDTAGSNEEFSNASSRADFELNLRCTAAPTPARQGGRSDHPSERRVRSRSVLPFERPELVPRRCATPSVVRSARPSSRRWWRRTTDSEWHPAARNEFETDMTRWLRIRLHRPFAPRLCLTGESILCELGMAPSQQAANTPERRSNCQKNSKGECHGEFTRRLIHSGSAGLGGGG
jgi:hypothetical protein